jgi:hypothetical protein
MYKRIIIFGAIFILIALLLYLACKIVYPSVVSRIIPTQTSIFTGPLDGTLIANLREPQGGGKISKVQAIGLAEFYCATANSLPKENPTNIEVNLMTEKEARSKLKGSIGSLSSKTVWLVSMDGLWEHEGPPPEYGTVVPILFKHCDVIIDAKSGDPLSLRNTGQ